MNQSPRTFFLLALVLGLLVQIPGTIYADFGESTRIENEKQHALSVGGGYPYREKADVILKELDLKPGDVVVDIGAGDGFWSEKMAEAVGKSGTVHSAEISDEKVEKLKKRLEKYPQAKPYVCPKDGTGLKENTCDLAFLSKTYHHLDKDGQVAYLRHLHDVVKPTGRLVVIEHHKQLGVGRQTEHAWSPGLLMQQAEEAGWIPVRYELITGTYHFIAVFAPKELFPLKK